MCVWRTVMSMGDPAARELPHLATFVKAAERGSFTNAAADLGVTQAAVSQRIAVLEKDYGSHSSADGLVALR